MNIRHIVKSLPICAFAISIISLLISFQSCVIANKAHQLNVQQYNDGFKTLWNGIYDQEKEVFSISPTNNKVMIKSARVYYPEKISKTDWPIDPPNNYLHFTSPKYSIEEEVKEKFKSQKGYIKIIEDNNIPAIIESYYTISGVSLYDKSLYVVKFNALIPDNEFERPSIRVKGLIFERRLNPEVEPKAYLNELWEKGST